MPTTKSRSPTRAKAFAFPLTVDGRAAAVSRSSSSRALAEKAESTCLVSASLDVPVATVIDARTPQHDGRANGEEAWHTIDEREREATSPGTPRLKWT